MRFLLHAILLLMCLSASATPSERLIDALVHVESNGQVHAVGDNGKAIGLL